MLTLTRIFLHNWHRFNHHVIEVEDSLYLAGHNGSGKSSVLDAIQLALVADLQRIRFNSSAQSNERSARTLDSYVRGKIGENRWLRPGNTVAYIALEFSDRLREDKRTIVGVAVEAGEGKGGSGERTYFILSEAFTPDLFTPDGRALPRRELKQRLRNRRGARTFDQVHEYLDEMRNRLGGLNPRFFDLFLRALAFQPIRQIGEFVEKWLLPDEELDVATLKSVVERLDSLRIAARQVEEKLVRLRAITAVQAEVLRLRQRHAVYIVLAALLRVVSAERLIQHLTEQIREIEEQMLGGQTDLIGVQAARKGADDALIQARVQLEQSDVMRRRNELEKSLREATRAANEITQRWVALRGLLRREADALQAALEGAQRSMLEEPEAESLQRLLACIAALTPDEAPPDRLPALIDEALPLLRGALERARQAKFKIEQQSSELKHRGEAIERELTALRDKGRAAWYPDHVERLRDLLHSTLGERPPLLCEQLEIPDPRWQDAVEAMLGARRFTVLVPPEQFDAALRVLDQARQRERIYEVRLLDLAKAASESREARPGSLAMEIETGDPLLRAYIDTILGDLITCERVDELRVHRRAVTPDVVFYGEWSVRAIRPDNFRPWFIGARAQRSQIEARERELESIRGELLALQPAFAAASSQVSLLEHGYELDKLRHRLDEPLDARPKWIEIEAFTAELQSLDMSGVEALKREVERLAAIANREQAAERQIVERLAQLRTRRQSLTEQNQAAAHELSEAGKQALDARAAFPAAVAAAEDLRAERLAGSQTDLIEVIRNAEIAARNFDTRANNEQQELTRLAAAYNTGYQFAGNAFDPAGDSYSNEEQRLAATELPSYQQQIAGEQQRAEQQLREHVLHRLREKILQARQELERINDALANLEFHNKRYRFRYQPNEQYRPYYELIMESQMLGAESLFESAFYQQHQGVFEDFYRQLTKANENERAPLTDYRRYLSYDIEVKQNDGQISSLSKIMGQTSGGETQTPFYLTIAASFLQLYRIGEESLMAKNGHQGGAARPGGRSTIRLVAFDEAFSKMDQDHIGSTLELFQKFNLQIITATPLERCEYLVPKMCTNLVLTAVGDTVLIEPYRNYAARLEDAYAD
jgi:uncharacterized protein YPO0396